MIRCNYCAGYIAKGAYHPACDAALRTLEARLRARFARGPR